VIWCATPVQKGFLQSNGLVCKVLSAKMAVNGEEECFCATSDENRGLSGEENKGVEKARHTVWAVTGQGNKPGLEDRRVPEKAFVGSIRPLAPPCRTLQAAVCWRLILRATIGIYKRHMLWGHSSTLGTLSLRVRKCLFFFQYSQHLF
jgi:hypothetical protein